MIGWTWRSPSRATPAGLACAAMAPGKDGRLLSEREALKARFLADANLSHARRELLAGDASTRRYERLHLPAGGALIFMDQPLSVETQPCPPDATDAER